MKRLVVEERERTYKHPTPEEERLWKQKNSPKRDRKSWLTHGTEIARELKVCPDCAAHTAAQELCLP